MRLYSIYMLTGHKEINGLVLVNTPKQVQLMNLIYLESAHKVP